MYYQSFSPCCVHQAALRPWMFLAPSRWHGDPDWSVASAACLHVHAAQRDQQRKPRFTVHSSAFTRWLKLCTEHDLSLNLCANTSECMHECMWKRRNRCGLGSMCVCVYESKISGVWSCTGRLDCLHSQTAICSSQGTNPWTPSSGVTLSRRATWPAFAYLLSVSKQMSVKVFWASKPFELSRSS